MHSASDTSQSTKSGDSLSPENATAFIDRVVAQTCGKSVSSVLDFGCGQGALVEGLRQRGYDAFGCDIFSNGRPDCRVIEQPYRLPYPDGSFDAVVSTSVLEHAQNTEEAFRECYRCLKSGGWAIHLLPGKWYLPVEPHIYVPLVNVMWPRVPRWWLGAWAILGVRNEFQHGKSWREVRDLNAAYCKSGLHYQSMRFYRDLSLKIFGNYEELIDLYIRDAYGGAARVLRKLPSVISRPLARFRMRLIAMHKS